METNNNSDEQNEMEPQEQEQQTAAAVKQDVTEPSEVPTMLHAQQQQSENQDSERREPYANYDDTLAQKSGTQTRVKEEPRDDQIVEANTMDITVDNSSTNNESKLNKPSVARVQESEEGNSESIAKELEVDNSLLLTSLQASFPDATGLKYRHSETNTLQSQLSGQDSAFNRKIADDLFSNKRWGVTPVKQDTPWELPPSPSAPSKTPTQPQQPQLQQPQQVVNATAQLSTSISQPSDSFRSSASVGDFHAGGPLMPNAFSTGVDGISSTANGLATGFARMGLSDTQSWRAPASKQHHSTMGQSSLSSASPFASHNLMNPAPGGMQKSMLNSGVGTGGDSFARAPGPATSMMDSSLTAKPFGVAQRASTWSSFGNPTSAESDSDWPKSTSNTTASSSTQSHSNAFDLVPDAFDSSKSGWNTSSMLMKGLGDDDTSSLNSAVVAAAAASGMANFPYGNAAAAAAAAAAVAAASKPLSGAAGGQYESSGIGTWSPVVKSGQGGSKWDGDGGDGRGDGGRFDDGTSIWGSPAQQAKSTGIDWADKSGDSQSKAVASNNSNNDKSRNLAAAGNNQAYRPQQQQQQQQSASSTSLLMSSSSSSNTSPSSSQHNRNQASSMKQASSISHNSFEQQVQQSNALSSQATQPNRGLGSTSSSTISSSASMSSSSSSSASSNVPSAQQLKHMVQQIQIAVQAGHLNPTILNQPLSPVTLQLLYQLLQQIKILHQIQQQFNKPGNHPATVNVHITKTKQNILNLQNQIAAQQAVYLKQTQAHNISSSRQQQQQQPTMPSLATGGVCLGIGGPTLPPGISQSGDSFRPGGSVGDFHTGTVSAAPLMNSFSSGFDGMTSSTANGLAGGLTGHMGLGGAGMHSSASASRFDQPWRAPASKQHHPSMVQSSLSSASPFASHNLMNPAPGGMQKSMLNSGVSTGNGASAFSSAAGLGGTGGDSFARAPGPATSMMDSSLTAKPFVVAQRASTWSSFGNPTSAESDSDWPKSTNTTAPGGSATHSHTNAFDLVPEFEPGKPWRGSMLMKSVEDDPTMTPGSMARSLAPQRKTIWSDEILQ